MALAAFYCVLSVACVGLVVWIYQFCMDCRKRSTRTGAFFSDNTFLSLYLVDKSKSLSRSEYDNQQYCDCAEPAEVGNLHILEVVVAYFLFTVAFFITVASALVLVHAGWCSYFQFGCQEARVVFHTAHEWDNVVGTYVNDTFNQAYDGMQTGVSDFALHLVPNLVHKDQLKSDRKMIIEEPDPVVEELTRSVLPSVRQGATAMVPVGVAYIASMIGSREDSDISKLACAAVTFYVHTKISDFASNPMPYLKRMEASLQAIIPRIDASLSEDWTTVDM